MRKLIIAALLAAFGLSADAQADPILLVVGPSPTFTQVPATGPWPVAPEDARYNAGPQGQMSIGTDEAPPAFPSNIPAGTEGYGGMYLELTDPGAPVTFVMMGHGDAGFDNEFKMVIPGCLDWTNAGTPIGTTATCVLIPSVDNLVPFEFVTPNGIVANDGASNKIPTLTGPVNTPNFGLFDVSQTALNQGRAFWIGLADGNFGNPGTDDDFQDMVIRVSVPEPGTLLLLSGALIALGSLRRRKLN